MSEAESDRPLATESADAESARAFRPLADNAPTLMWRAGADRRRNWFNRTWLAFTGRTLQEELGVGWVEGVHDKDRERCITTYAEGIESRQPFSIEYRLRRHDGVYQWIRDNGAPFELEDGRFGGYVGSAVDVTEQRRQQSLIDELNHRVKNTLATVRSIALQTFRKVPDVDGPLRLFEGRLSAVAASQDLLSRRDWRGATLHETVEAALRPFGLGGSAIDFSGPEVTLTPRQVTALSFALHELASNATRFGALSGHGGRVRVWWDTVTSDSGTQLRLTWREEGGPRVSPPSNKGFGTRMIERGLTHELAATTELSFRPDGLVCTIRSELGG